MCLWTAQTLSELGAKIGLLAIPLIGAVLLHATPFQMGVLAAAETSPYLLLGLVAGSWVDRLPKRVVMVAADLSRAALLLVVPLLASLGVLSIELLCVVAFLIGTAEVWFNIASAAYTPIVVGKDSLIDANSKLALSSSGAEAMGPAAAGALIQLASAPVALIGNSLSYALSALFIRASAHVSDRPRQFGDAKRPRIRDDVRAGVRFVFTSDILRAVTLRLAAWQFVVGTGNALLVYFTVHELGLSSVVVGSLFSVMGAGVLVGAVVVKPLSDKLGIGQSIMFSVATAAVVALLIPLASGPAFWRGLMVAAALFVYGLNSTIYEVNNVTLRQSLTPPEMLGRMTSTVRVSTLGLRPLGALLGGALGGAIGIRETLIVVISLGLILSLVSLFVSPLWQVPHRHQLREIPVER
jgi:MFS family permease